MTLRLSARELAAMDKPTLWAIQDGPLEVEFDPLPDGTPQILLTDSRPTIFSAYMWQLYVEYPRTPTRIAHHLGWERITNKSHMKLMNAVMWDCYDAYQGEVDMEDICRLLYGMTNAYYNDFTTKLEAEVSTISIEELFDAVEEPRVAEAIAGITGSPATIDHAYSVAMEVWEDPEAIPTNPISASLRSKLVSPSQVKQCLVARGRVTDIDSHFFNEAIPDSFLSGMNALFESMIESRSSTKAAAYKEKPIQDSEYFNRRLQLLAATVEEVKYVVDQAGTSPLQIEPGDCGSQRYVRWTVKAKDLEALDGKYYKTEEGLKLITAKSRDLIGKTILFRSPLLCNHPTPQSVCATCYGDLAFSLPRGTNIGHVAAVEYGERVTQQMLGIKHVDFATGMRRIILGPYEKEFLEPASDSRGLKLLNKYKNFGITISIAPGDADQLNEINFVKDVTTLPVGRISEVSEILMTLTDAKGERETVSLNVEVSGKKAHLTHALLAHIQLHGYTLSDSGRYVIDLVGFDREQALFEVPNRDENILDYLNSIIQFISSTDEKSSSQEEAASRRMLKGCHSIEEALIAFHDLTSAKMLVNIVHLEILVYATTVRSLTARDYRLPYPDNALVFGQLSRIIGSRSLAAAMAFEKHSSLLLDPATYTNRTRPEHPLDDLLVPRKAAK